MQHHASSISKLNQVSRVTFIGYNGEKCFEQIESNSKITKISLSPLSSIPKGLFFTLFKGILLCIQILSVLIRIPHYHLILIQNPPSLPVALVSFLLSYFYNNSTIMIDWHNLGDYSWTIFHHLVFRLTYV